MIGRHHVRIHNNFLRYDFDVIRNITVIEGNSATGKTSLVEMIQAYKTNGIDSGVTLVCDKKCVTLEGIDWKNQLGLINDSIVFIDEGNRFVETKEFAAAIKNTDNYYVIVTRERLDQLPYSVSEIYGIHSSGKYNDLKQTYNEFYRVFDINEDLEIKPDTVIVEDSNSGFEFYKELFAGCECISAGGKSNIYQLLIANIDRNILVIADGAAFGSEMNRIMQQVYVCNNCKLYLPESFEWLILKSGLIDGRRVQEILINPEDFIDSKNFFSWERYFTKLLIDETQNSYLAYSKSDLNKAFLQKKEKDAIIIAMKV